MSEREKLVAAHERQRGIAWCELKDVEFCGVQEKADGSTCLLYNVPTTGSTKVVEWNEVNETLKSL